MPNHDRPGKVIFAPSSRSPLSSSAYKKLENPLAPVIMIMTKSLPSTCIKEIKNNTCFYINVLDFILVLQFFIYLLNNGIDTLSAFQEGGLLSDKLVYKKWT